MEEERRRLGLSHKEYILYIRAENQKMMAKFRRKASES